MKPLLREYKKVPNMNLLWLWVEFKWKCYVYIRRNRGVSHEVSQRGRFCKGLWLGYWVITDYLDKITGNMCEGARQRIFSDYFKYFAWEQRSYGNGEELKVKKRQFIDVSSEKVRWAATCWTGLPNMTFCLREERKKVHIKDKSKEKNYLQMTTSSIFFFLSVCEIANLL